MRRICLLFLCQFVVALSLAAPQRTLSLEDAILLAIRENPNVKQSQLSYISEKYALDIAKWQFRPHYAFSATRTTFNNYSVTEESEGYVTRNETGANASVSWLSPYGTSVKLKPAVNQTDHFHPELSLEIMQPLLRGFGRPVVEAALYNAIDSEKISRLSVEGSLRSTVTAVINAYLDVVSATQNLEVDQKALNRAEVSVRETKLFIKSGRKAGVELVTVEADVANARSRIENDKNNVDQARHALLTAIGIDPSTPVTFSSINVPALIKKYQIPSLVETKKLTLDNDLSYQTSKITLAGAKKRSVIEAQDKTWWELNVSGSAQTGGGAGGGPNAGLRSLINGVNQVNMLTLNLTVPIDDRQAKVAYANAKIGLRQATIALQQDQWSKETNAINGWNSIYSAERALQFAENAEDLQQKTWNMSFQKYSHGLIDSLQLQSAQQQLISSGLNLNMARINYLKSLVNLDQMIGRTLKTWKIDVRYGVEENG